MKRNLLIFFAGLLSLCCRAQKESLYEEEDSVLLLSPVLIKGYESARSLLETPVAVGYVGPRDLKKYASATLIPAVNQVPGVRMEERSPGSYRLNIRGSLLRSPFGIRNVKVYWNDLPFTDAGGNTYLNLLDPNTIRSIEILKGPAGSLYGANTGGVVVLHPDELPVNGEEQTADHRFRVQLNGGSYGLFGEQVLWKYRNRRFSSTLSQNHLQADGYRRNSNLRRDVLQWNGQASLSARDKAEWILLYSDLHYQTPGGINLSQMMQNPRQARQPTPTLPGAEQQKAGIFNKTFFSGCSNTHSFNEQWSHTASVSYSHTGFKNPFITNYETRDEDNLAFRTKFVYAADMPSGDFRLVAGVEWLYGTASINNYGNRGGEKDTVQNRDKLWVRQWFPFVQGEWKWKNSLMLQAGLSTNSYQYRYRRLTDPGSEKRRKKFDEQLLPRVAILYPFSNQVSAYVSAGKGFSPATLAEIRASDANINTDLQPESGWNFELGLRGLLIQNRLQAEAAIYFFSLEDAIVRRNNALGAEYFINAGGTRQKGIELRVSGNILSNPASFIPLLRLWSSFTYNDYLFTNYQVGSTDHSGKALTGVPRYVSVTGIDVQAAPGVYLHASLNHTARLPLNDANDEYASSYNLLQAKCGWRKPVGKLQLEIYAGADNLLNEEYSLGNDINAAGRRYYNPSPLRNYFAGVIVEF